MIPQHQANIIQEEVIRKDLNTQKSFETMQVIIDKFIKYKEKVTE